MWISYSICITGRSHRGFGLARGESAPGSAAPRTPFYGSGSSAPDYSVDPAVASSGQATPGSTGSGTSAQSVHMDGSPGSSANSRSVQSSVQQQEQPATTSRVMTRLQKGIRNPKIRRDGTIPYGMLCVSGEPARLSDALEDPKWRKAMVKSMMHS